LWQIAIATTQKMGFNREIPITVNGRKRITRYPLAWGAQKQFFCFGKIINSRGYFNRTNLITGVFILTK
jgi:hypothetical protein